MLLAGLTAMLINYQVLRSGDDGTAVAVLAQDVAAGEPLTSGQLRFVEVTATPELLSTLVTADGAGGVEGLMASTDLHAGTLLRVTDLQPGAAPDGQRAMSIPVDAEHAAAGRIEPGDRIDVIEVRDGRAEFLLAGAVVLDVSSPETRAGIAASRAFSITVAIDDERALRLALAIREGSLEVIRSTGAPPPTVTHLTRESAQPAGPAPDQR